MNPIAFDGPSHSTGEDEMEEVYDAHWEQQMIEMDAAIEELRHDDPDRYQMLKDLDAAYQATAVAKHNTQAEAASAEEAAERRRAAEELGIAGKAGGEARSSRPDLPGMGPSIGDDGVPKSIGDMGHFGM